MDVAQGGSPSRSNSRPFRSHHDPFRFAFLNRSAWLFRFRVVELDAATIAVVLRLTIGVRKIMPHTLCKFTTGVLLHGDLLFSFFPKGILAIQLSGDIVHLCHPLGVLY
jgi:hypothetical protein